MPDSRPSLRTELLVNFAILAVAALSFAVASVVMLYGELDPAHAIAYISILIAADVTIVVGFGAYQLHRLVMAPLRDVAGAAESIAAGNLHRRVPTQGSSELHQLADSVNRMTERLLEEQAQLVRAEKLASVGRLAAGVAHEIGNPLGALNGYAHLLRGHLDGRDDALEAVGGVERETARIDRIVRGLLDYARPRRATPVPIDVNDALRRVVDLLNAQGVLRRVSLRLELSNESPLVHGDRHDLEQVLVNLLLNAADAVGADGTVAIRTTIVTRDQLEGPSTRRAGDAPTMTVRHAPNARVRQWLDRGTPPSHVVKLIVADSGPGVPVEDAERIFDPFFTTKEPGKGTGLGLAIVARVVENLHGIVWVESAREGGAAFHLIFPIVFAGASSVPTLPQPVA